MIGERRRVWQPRNPSPLRAALLLAVLLALAAYLLGGAVLQWLILEARAAELRCEKQRIVAGLPVEGCRRDD